MSLPEIMRDSIYGTCFFEVSNGNFTLEQKTEMIEVLEKYKITKAINIFKTKKLLDKFEALFLKYDGDAKALEQKIVKNSGVVEMAKKIPGVAKHILENDIHTDNERR